MKKRLFVALGLAALASACGRQRQPNVAPGEERVFRKTLVAEAGPGVSSRVKEDEVVVSEPEARRRAKVRDLEKLFQEAKSADDRLDPLDKIIQQGIEAPELVPYVARCLTDPDADQRIYGIKARVIISKKDALPDVKLVLNDAEAKVRQAAVEAFGLLPEPLPFDVLFERLSIERDPVVQQAITLTIARRGTEAQVARVLGSMRDLDLKAVGPIVDLARKFPAASRSHADELAYFLDRNDPDLRLQVAKLLGEWGTRSPAVIGGLVRALDDADLSVRKAAFTALKSFSSRDFGYNPDVEPAARREALARWRAWAKQAASDGKAPEERGESGPASR